MKIREIFNLNNNLKSLKILAGEGGLDREIKDIEIVEVPDGIYWINEGDLAITTAYFLHKEGSDLTSWIEVLNEKGGVGLGIKTGRFLKKISESDIERANELDFPLFEIPIHLGYSDMTWPIISKILGEKDYINLRFEKYNEELLNFSSKNYVTRDIFPIMKKYMKNPFAAFSFYNNKIESISNSENELPIANIIFIINNKNEVINTSSDFICIDREDKKIWITALRAEGEIVGYFSILSNDDSYIEVDFKMSKLSFPYLILGILLEKSYDYLRYNSKEDFLKSLMHEEITNKIKLKSDAAYYNIAFDLRRIVWIIEINPKEEFKNNLNKIYEIINSKFTLNEMHIIFENNRIIFINNVNENPYDKAWFRHLIKELEYKLPKYSFKIGVSKIFDSLNKLYTAYDEAKFCLENALKVEGENIQLFDDLIIYYVLNEISRHPQLTRLYEDTIKKLKDYDINYGTELVKTIGIYIENNYNVLKTSQDLYIHRNTLYKRLKKIENIIDLNMKESDKNFILSLGLRLDKLYNS